MQTMREKKAEEQEITLLQSNATINQPNTSIINKLKKEMFKLQECRVSTNLVLSSLFPWLWELVEVKLIPVYYMRQHERMWFLLCCRLPPKLLGNGQDI